nr:hypothetical protein [Tanacetum cinerariifolium]
MEILSRSKDVEGMMMMTKNPPLDQTEGPREEELEKNMSKSAQAEEPIHTTEDLEEPAPQEFNTCFTNDRPVEEVSPIPNWFQKSAKPLTPDCQQYPHDLRKPLPLMPNSKGRCVIPFDHFTNNDLAYLSGGASSRTYATSVTKTKAADYGHIKWIEDLVLNTTHKIISVTKLQLVEWHNYKHLDWITIRRNDDKLYTFKEGDYKRLRLQDIKDMLLLLVQGKLINLTIEKRLALNVSLRMFIRSIVIQRCVEDLQLGVKSYQKNLNLIRPDTYRSDLKRLPTYSAYPNQRGFIYQNKHKKNRLMRIDELHKFSDGTLNDVQMDLDDILKRIRMQYLQKTYRRNVEKERAGAMIQAIDKQLKNRRIMRSLEKFVGGRPYEGDFRLLEMTI